tara:strand:- start:227 stop:568 length:342 start_codon:yes stop_codon:yes gene_type:complete
VDLPIADSFGPSIGPAIAWFGGIVLGTALVISFCALTSTILIHRRAKNAGAAVQLKWALIGVSLTLSALLLGGATWWMTKSAAATALALFLMGGLAASVAALWKERVASRHAD